jgi:hypothetical protein
MPSVGLAILSHHPTLVSEEMENSLISSAINFKPYTGGNPMLDILSVHTYLH